LENTASHLSEHFEIVKMFDVQETKGKARKAFEQWKISTIKKSRA
jgi:hypothetical protein